MKKDDIDLKNKENKNDENSVSDSNIDVENSSDNEKIKNLLIELENQKKLNLANLENQRKSNLKEIEHSIKYSNERLLLKIIKIFSDFERAISFSNNSDDKKIKNFFSGFSMILDDFKKTLFGEGIEEYSPNLLNDIWDSNYCEVVDEIENNDYKHGTILNVIQKGYFLNKRLILPAKVIISKEFNANKTDIK